MFFFTINDIIRDELKLFLKIKINNSINIYEVLLTITDDRQLLRFESLSEKS